MEQYNGKELARVVADSLNSFNFNNDEFCKQMKFEHRTIQQNFMRLVRRYIEDTASAEKWDYDDRNEASVMFARAIMQNVDPDDMRLPFI